MPIVSLTHWTEQFSTIGEQAFLGITMLLVGITLVLIILVSLSIIVSLMSKIISGAKKEGPPSAPQIKEEPKPATVSNSAAAAGNEHDPAIIAVIAAAVQAMMNGDKSSSAKAGFTIRRIRRV